MTLTKTDRLEQGLAVNSELLAAERLLRRLTRYTKLETARLKLIERTLDDQLQAIEQE